jgi:hypothetical protein
MKSGQWKTYRTRFLVKAKQLSSSLSFVDHLGRQHCGRKGDYLVESSDGVISIAPRQIFEDIYVAMSLLGDPGTGETLIGEKTPGEATINETTPSDPDLSRVEFEALRVEAIKLRKSSVPRQRVDELPALPNDEGTRVRRKLPQPCRDRRGSAPGLRLM